MSIQQTLLNFSELQNVMVFQTKPSSRENSRANKANVVRV